MPAPESTQVSLRFWGDDLVPDEVSQILGCKPTKSEQKGEALIGKITGQERIAKTGGWRLRAPERLDGNLDLQIVEFFEKLPNELPVWCDLTCRFEADLFCGVFLKTGNDGLKLRSSTLHMLGERGLCIDFDIYDSSDE